MRTFKCSDCGETGSSMWGTICEKCMRKYSWQTKETERLENKMSKLILIGGFLLLLALILIIILCYYVHKFYF